MRGGERDSPQVTSPFSLFFALARVYCLMIQTITKSAICLDKVPLPRYEALRDSAEVAQGVGAGVVGQGACAGAQTYRKTDIRIEKQADRSRNRQRDR